MVFVIGEFFYYIDRIETYGILKNLAETSLSPKYIIRTLLDFFSSAKKFKFFSA